MYDFKPPVNQEDTQPESDSLRFVKEFLEPSLKRFDGDYNDELCQKIINKFWGTTSRGLIVSNYSPPLLINESGWKTTKDTNGKDIISSNDDYFNVLKRGTEYERRKAEDEAKAEAERLAKTNQWRYESPSGSQRQLDFQNYRPDIEGLTMILQDFELWDLSEMGMVAAMTSDELKKVMTEAPDSFVMLFEWFASCHHQIQLDLKEVEKKHGKATIKISELVTEIKELKAELKKAGDKK